MTTSRLRNPRSATSAGLLAATGRDYAYDADAEAYIASVEAADGDRLEWGVRQAISEFVLGCKTDNIWSAIKASCVLCGARTLSGALTPLVGSAPTNNNFVSGDYSRTLGLLGNGSTKYLNSNRNNTADAINSSHVAVLKTDFVSASNPYYIGCGDSAAGATATIVGQNGAYSRSGTAIAGANAANGPGLYGASRSSSTAVTYRRPIGEGSATNSSSTQTQTNALYVFAWNNNGTATAYSASRLAFYSIGTDLNLTQLSDRASALFFDIRSALT